MSMSGLKLCRTKQGKRAYYIPLVKCNIYSLEELCYCIYNNDTNENNNNAQYGCTDKLLLHCANSQ